MIPELVRNRRLWVGDLFACIYFLTRVVCFVPLGLVWVLRCAYGRYTGQVGGDKMGGKLAFAESTNGVQFTRSEGPSLVLYTSTLTSFSAPICPPFSDISPIVILKFNLQESIQ